MVYLSGRLLKSEENSHDNTGIEVKYTGLQKGEKIHEELFIGDNITTTKHPMIMKAQEDYCEWRMIDEMMTAMDPQHILSEGKMRQLLMQYATNKNKDNLT
jgi:FlaA1/EpsC-like NDP-sugar epimerase